jgi:thiol:disulfide interchange protein DsbA
MFRSTVAAFALALLAPFVAAETAAPAAPQSFVEGKDYARLDYPVRTRNSAKIEVVEVFAYTCPHCFRFDPLVKAWKKTIAADVDFFQSPIVWDDLAQFHAQMFYTAQALYKLDRLHDSFFEAIHVQNNMLNTPDKIYALFAKQGVSREQFDKVFSSQGVDSQVTQAKSRALSYRISGTPEMVVNGKYRISGNMAGKSLSEADAHKRMLQVVDFLIAKEREAKTAAK